MLIGFDAKRLFHNLTGLGNYSRNLLQSLADFFPAHQYLLYTPWLNNASDFRSFLKPPFYVKTAGKLPAGLWRSMGIGRELTKDQIQLFHGLSHELPFQLPASIKKVVTIHDLIFKVFPGQYPLLQRQIYDFKYRYACKHADSIIAISEHTKSDIVRFYRIDPDKIKVIHQSCDPAFQPFQEGTPIIKNINNHILPEQYLLYVGSITERKNLLNLARALKLLPSDLQIPLLVVGTGKTYEKIVRRYLAENGLQKRVIFLKNINTYELVTLYQQATLLIYPSSYEGFGIPVIEALSCGTPVLTTAFASLPEAGGSGAHYIQSVDPEEIGVAIAHLLQDERYRNQLSRAGLEYVRRFDRQVLAEEMMQHYKQLINEKHG